MTQANAPQVRLRFAKRGDLRLVSHHDLMRCLERMVRRAGIPLATTQGFNPRPKIVFALALGLGVEALREVVDLELSQPLPPEEVLERLSATAPPGFVWLEAQNLGPGESPPRPQAVVYQLDLPADRRAEAQSALAALLASSSWPFERRRPDRTVTLDLRPFLIDAALTDQGSLEFRVKVSPQGTVRGEEVVEALGLSDLLERGTVLVRTDVELLSTPSGHPQTNPLLKGTGSTSLPSGDRYVTELTDPTPDSPRRSLAPSSAAPGPIGAEHALPLRTPDPLGQPDRI